MATRRRRTFSRWIFKNYSNCVDDFVASGVRLVGEFDNEVGEREDDKLDVDIVDGEEHPSSWLLQLTGDVTSSTSLIIIIWWLGAIVISTSSSELVDSGDREQLPLLLLSLVVQRGTRSRRSGLLLLNKFFLSRLGSVSGNGASAVHRSRSSGSWTRNGCWLVCGSDCCCVAGEGLLKWPSAMRLCSNS